MAVEYVENGGVLHLVLRRLLREETARSVARRDRNESFVAISPLVLSSFRDQPESGTSLTSGASSSSTAT